MNKDNQPPNTQPIDDERKKQIEKMVDRLENKRAILNQAAEKQYEETGDLSGLVFCEEQEEFNQISNEIIGLLSELHSISKDDEENQ